MNPEDERNNVVEYVFQLINRLKRSMELTLDKILEMQTKIKVWYDRKAIRRELFEGDLVLVVSTSKPNKLTIEWKGPGKIDIIRNELCCEFRRKKRLLSSLPC
ncbi:hypothetical protein AVEN_203655-1 [Araneus ventricosus]|uniref:DUF5641 domain-containing protein n=1 Tax=Araneus ventricosus TaxID=182803 RepID=A0A4Y2F013_ARAVE|nr:hypothetical protein AVEN_203655-1 [Araneus ventricosus]